MAQADFDFESGGLAGGAWVGGDDGTARLHAGLSSPLTGEGDYCRDFSTVNTTLYITKASIKASVSAGLFDEIPSTQAISVRAWIRAEGYTNGISIGIIAKLHPTSNGNGRENPVGYNLFVGGAADTANNSNLKLHLRKDNSTYKNVYLNALTINTWYKIRLDVIPVGSSQDIVKVYTGVGATGSETWTLEHTEVILNTDPHYVPWAQSGGGKIGFTARNEASTDSVYIDRFQAFVETV